MVELFDDCMFDAQNMVDPKRVDKYELVTEFDKKFPLMFIRFFGRNSKMLCSHDMEFVSWLTSRTKMKAKSNPQFESILHLIEKEKKAATKIGVFMN